MHDMRDGHYNVDNFCQESLTAHQKRYILKKKKKMATTGNGMKTDPTKTSIRIKTPVQSDNKLTC